MLQSNRKGILRNAVLAGTVLWMAGMATASEGGASVYPAGVETVMPGRMPGDGQTMLLEFNNFYQANELSDGAGHALLPGFHLRVAAWAPKLVHNWGLHVLGGSLVSTAALPLVYIHLDAPFGRGEKAGISNPDLETLVAYKKGSLHWWYGLDGYTPGFSYNKNDLVNVGQHNYAVAPTAAFTYLPDHGRDEISSKFQFIHNYIDGATNYQSGNEFIWEFDGMRSITKAIAVGFNGYYYQQTSNDIQNGLIFAGGNRGRNTEFGPEIRCHFSHYAMILKYEKDFLTENRPVGNSIWLQFGIPLSSHHD